MQKFNIALLPINETHQILFREISLSYFSQHQDGYILGKNALAHVTLCHFRAPDEACAYKAFASLSFQKSYVFSIQEFRLRQGTDEHSGFWWAEFLINKALSLLEIQHNCLTHLIEEGLEPLTPVESYSPHITLARVTNQHTRLPVIDDIPDRNHMAFSAAIGLSTENGVFVKTLRGE